MKKWGIVGIGKLGTAIVSRHPEENIGIYHPDMQKKKQFIQNYPHTYPLTKRELKDIHYLILCLPANQIALFLRETRETLQNTLLINMATSLKTNALHLQFPSLTIVGMKLTGHSQSLKVYGNGLFITDRQKATYEVIQFFERMGTVLNADESLVLEVNKTATAYAIEAALEIEKKLHQKGYEDAVKSAALESIVPEVIRSYMQGTLGHFGQEIAQEIRKRIK